MQVAMPWERLPPMLHLPLWLLLVRWGPQEQLGY